MSFLDIKDPAKKATLVRDYVTAMKTVKQLNMVNRQMKLEMNYKLFSIQLSMRVNKQPKRLGKSLHQ